MLNCKWFLDKGKEKAKGDIYVLEKRKEGKKKKRDKHGNLLIWKRNTLNTMFSEKSIEIRLRMSLQFTFSLQVSKKKNI